MKEMEKKIMIFLERKETGCARCDIRLGIINYIVCPSKLFPPVRAIIIFLRWLIGPESAP
jgi:hypothetical protein